jgi:hypothetical protein
VSASWLWLRRSWLALLAGAVFASIAFLILYATILKACAIDGTLIATWAIAALGAVSAVVAAIAYGAGQREKRVDRTLTLIREWLLPIGDTPSPDACFTFLDFSSEARGVLAEDFRSGSKEYELTRRHFVRLHNYFDEAWTLHKSNIIDTPLFVFQQQNLIRESAALLEPFYQAFDSRRDVPTPRPLSIFMALIESASKTMTTMNARMATESCVPKRQEG